PRHPPGAATRPHHHQPRHQHRRLRRASLRPGPEGLRPPAGLGQAQYRSRILRPAARRSLTAAGPGATPDGMKEGSAMADDVPPALPLSRDQAYALVDAVMAEDDLAITASAYEDEATGEWIFEASALSEPDLA